ncbi:IclR family transcriptional regulator domain-containing protein [Bradyrhizobium cenepequi]|uniref:IclR family transcriptional regulator domain-containing protein n=1 Tax=Bradyrhizobium cenepequi TaxID=2821403 RepID=UPI001CE35CA9|nr:IclR family transcriptional regulator C-terminal domain-containing protein [Bradyrhizobium cenepequi]MCA6112941.1 helix-turn-helix domain-containing protein [Bradyrhizobium cenepequi]
MASRLPEGMGGLAKGLAILESFSPRRTRLTITEAAEAAETSRASARRCLLTLAELGYLEFDGKFFRPQARLLALSAGFSGTRALPQVAQPFLAAARDKLNESISLAVLDGELGLFVARAEAERLVTTGIQIGTRMDLYASATGRVLLAGWSDERVAAYLDRTALKARTKHSLVKKAALREAVRETRTVGYAYTDQELEIGLRSVAVPVFDADGAVVAAMSASASSARVTVAQMVKGFVPVLRRHADELSRIL